MCPNPQFKGKPFTVYFQDTGELETLSKLARENRTTTSAFILDLVRRGLSESVPGNPNPDEKDSEETLKQLNTVMSRLEQCQKDLNNQKKATDTYSAAVADNERVIMASRGIIKLLSAGGTFPSQKIINVLGVDQTNPDEMKILRLALYNLQGMGLVKEGVQGWSWYVNIERFDWTTIRDELQKPLRR
jgi:hypothetical protein